MKVLCKGDLIAIDQWLNIAQNAQNGSFIYSFFSKIFSKLHFEMVIIMEICLIYNLLEIINCICFTEIGIRFNISRRYLFYINSYQYAHYTSNCLMLTNTVIIKCSLNVCQAGTFITWRLRLNHMTFFPEAFNFFTSLTQGFHHGTWNSWLHLLLHVLDLPH